MRSKPAVAAPAVPAPALATRRARAALGDLTNVATRVAAAAAAAPAACGAGAPMVDIVTIAAPTLSHHSSVLGGGGGGGGSGGASSHDVVMATFDPFDVDAGDLGDPQACAEYARDIHAYYRTSEMAGCGVPAPRARARAWVPAAARAHPAARALSRCASAGYMTARQRDINEKMRAILIDWLAEVHLKFKLSSRAMYLTVNLIDRYLEQVEVRRAWCCARPTTYRPGLRTSRARTAGRTEQAPARGRDGYAHRGEIRGDLRPRGEGLRVHHGQGPPACAARRSVARLTRHLFRRTPRTTF